ncbi:MAG: Epoxyqueuosine reductase [Promethearchaeota archaeon]|nr:MAG: Epoxyqueuosine reductase [Candidatus Lokiarchaeota archaeon]
MVTKKWFNKKISSFLENDPSNKMDGLDGQLIFDPEVLVGFCSGQDPIFDEYKKRVGPFHLTPKEAFDKFCRLNDLQTEGNRDITVVAYILPINQITKKENYEYSKEWPSERWAHTRLYGEKANQKLQKYLLNELKREFGVLGVAPMTEKKLFKIHRKHKDAYQGVWASTWSHRHICFAAGLGSFGLSDGFLNEKGKAMRCGSIVINHKLASDANKRPSDPYEYCTNCGDCIERCPVSAISYEGGHDKQKCSEKVMATIPYIKKNYQINIYACGLCQVEVSCSNAIPLKK